MKYCCNKVSIYNFQTHEETLLTLNRTTSELGLKKDQVVQVRDMLAAERSGKEKLNAKFVAQLEAARKRIGTVNSSCTLCLCAFWFDYESQVIFFSLPQRNSLHWRPSLRRRRLPGKRL